MQTKDSRPEQPPWRLFDIQRSISPLSSLFDLCVTMLRLATGKSTICSVLFFISAPITPNVGWTRKNSPFSRARVRRFSIFSFTASPFAPNLLRDRMMRVKASPFCIHPRWRQKCAFCSPVLAWISGWCDRMWRVKAGKWNCLRRATRIRVCEKTPISGFSTCPKVIEKTWDDFGKSSRVFEKRRELFHDWSATNYKEVVVYFEDPYAAWQKGAIKMQLNLSGRIVQNTATSMGLPIQRLRVYRRNQ